jgi:hypothetical protein
VLGSPIALQSHQAGSPSNMQVVHNTVINQDAGIVVRNVVGPVVVANNAVYAQTGSAIRLVSGNLGMVTVAGNVGQGGLSGASSGYVEGKGIGADFVAATFGVPPIDVFPRAGSALIGAASSGHTASLDFNGTSRSGSLDAGAYRFNSAGNPGWRIVAGFKNAVRPKPPMNVTAE